MNSLELAMSELSYILRSMPTNNSMSNEQLMAVAQSLIGTAPAFENDASLTDEDLRWLARTEALIDMASSISDLVDFRNARRRLGSGYFSRSQLLSPLVNVYHRLELRSPLAQNGNFIPPGDTWGGYAAIVRLIQKGVDELLLVDPYLDVTLFTDLLPHSETTGGTKCLTSKGSNHASLQAAYAKWQKDEIGKKKPVELRIAPTRSLHDRLIIIDKREVWVVSQSFKDIAARSPASVTRADGELAEHKIRHYLDLWEQGSPALGDSFST